MTNDVYVLPLNDEVFRLYRLATNQVSLYGHVPDRSYIWMIYKHVNL